LAPSSHGQSKRHTFRIAVAALAVETSLDAATATKVLISNTLGPA
jgi:hypothetical protein